jgi:hypothetical protein
MSDPFGRWLAIGGVALAAMLVAFETAPSRGSGNAYAATRDRSTAAIPLVSPLVRATARVIGVEHLTRTVSLRKDDGAETTIAVPPALKAFDHLRIGERIGIDYYDSLALSMSPAGATQLVAATRSPGGREITAAAEIVTIDLTGHQVSFQGPHGQKTTVSVADPDLRWRLPSFRAGQVVQLRYTEAVAVAIHRNRR